MTVAPAGDGSRIRFATAVVPILTRLSCNSGGCHGKATGQNGFSLSLLGFEPEFDFQSLVHDARGRRLFPGDADRSLLMMKATARMPHGGGRRLDERSDDYRILREWIALGAAAPHADGDPLLETDRDLVPGTRRPQDQFDSPAALLVTAALSPTDPSPRRLTRQGGLSNRTSPTSARSMRTDLVIAPARQARPGRCDGALSVRRSPRFMGPFRSRPISLQTASTADQPLLRRLDAVERQIGDSKFDRLLLQAVAAAGGRPVQRPADDATFHRRAMIDICGTLPTIDEVEAYRTDSRLDKRARLIDRLLDRPEYASYFALKWADIVLREPGCAATRPAGRRLGTALFAGWIRDSIAANKPYDQFVSEILTASGSQNENPPAIWYRTVRKSPEFVESVAQAFLGVRIQCAQCHHHPAERWSQADYYALAAVFARVGRKGGFADAEVPTDEIIYVKATGDVAHPRTGKVVHPRALGGPDFEIGRFDDPRQGLARWMTSAENPFFARTLANRLWAHFLGRGIIHPIDDSRSTNPPSNPELLDALAHNFIASGYDVKHLIRVIGNSYAYGLESVPNEWNARDTQTFARFYPRRLSAEVLLDGISQVLDVPTEFAGGPGKIPSGTRAIDLPDENVAAHFLDVFGRPSRMSACECERVDAPALTQALELVNSAEIQRKLTADKGYAKRLAGSGQSNAERGRGSLPPRPGAHAST